MGMRGNNIGMGGNNMGNSMGMNNGDNPNSSNHRPLVGGGAAAAFNAAREDHYRQMEENKKKEGMGGNQGNSDVNPMAGLGGNMSSGMGMGNMGGGGGGGGGSNIPSFGLSVNPNQHYEMLKLHHMNLLNEIQETTLMMNLYQQQQLQQQQQQQQQQMRNMGGGVSSIQSSYYFSFPFHIFCTHVWFLSSSTYLLQMGMGMMNQGGGGGMMNNQGGSGVGSGGNDSSSSVSGNVSLGRVNEEKTDEEKAAWLKKLKDDIAAQEKEAAELEASIAGDKRKTNDEGDYEPNTKKVRAQE